MKDLVKYVAEKLDNTLLSIDVDRDKLINFVERSVDYGVRAVVLHPYFIGEVADIVRGTTRLCSVVAFPYGFTGVGVKIREAEYCIDKGVDELDIVLNTYLLRAGLVDKFRDESYLLRKYISSEYGDITLKFIVEVTLLSREELDTAISIINDVGPDFFKTSTGHGPRGTTVDDVKYIRGALDKGIGLKAAGGIRELRQFLALVEAGADIIGASRGFDIIREAVESSK